MAGYFGFFIILKVTKTVCIQDFLIAGGGLSLIFSQGFGPQPALF